jgi:hypothetical protein
MKGDSMARKFVFQKADNLLSATLLRIAALILVSGIASYFEHRVEKESLRPAS